MGDGAVARRYHRETAHVRGRLGHRRTAPGFMPMDPRNRPAPFKRYPALAPRPLPTDLPPGANRAVDVLSGRSERAAGEVDLGFLARLLYYAGGVTRVTGEGARTYFRAAPSAGNLHPLETYVISGPIGGLHAGVYHFAPDVFGLEPLRSGDHRAFLADAAADPAAAGHPLALVVCGVPWRTAWKYGERGWRHLYWDAGAMLANLLAVADAYGVEARPAVGFHDTALAALLGVDGIREFPLAVATVGPPDPAPGGRRGPGPGGWPPDLDDLSFEATPIAPRPLDLPAIVDVQWAGDLDDPSAVRDWRAARPAGPPAPPEPPEPLEPPEPPAGAPAEPIEEVILRRGSTRAMRRDAVPSEVLTWAMRAATRPSPLDALAPGRTVLSHELSVHGLSVHGMSLHGVADTRSAVAPGLYHWRDGQLRPYRHGSEGETRARAAMLCLDQPLGGDSAYTLFACCDLDRTLAAYGDRGYRLAQLEAGLVAGRLQLAAFALGYGGTGLTFYDEEVATAFGTRAACMLVTAIGVPAYRARRGGPPGHPTELTGFA